MAPVKLQDVVSEMDLLSGGLQAYLNKQTGRLITISTEELEAAEAGEALDSYSDWEREALQEAQDVLNSEDYVLLPSQFEIHEYAIMERFCDEIEDAELSNRLLAEIRGSGAFRRFKQAIDRYGVTEDWYRYRQKALEEIAIDWLEEHGIEYQRG